MGFLLGDFQPLWNMQKFLGRRFYKKYLSLLQKIWTSLAFDQHAIQMLSTRRRHQQYWAAPRHNANACRLERQQKCQKVQSFGIASTVAELLLQPIFNELSALAVEVSCFLKLTSTDFSPREKKLRSEKKVKAENPISFTRCTPAEKTEAFCKEKKQHLGTEKKTG